MVLDAGVATEENLRMLDEKGYDYVCVSRRKAHPESDPSTETVQNHLSRQGTELTLKGVKDKGLKDYFLKVHSTAKKATEEGMKNLFEQRFEEELTKIAQSLAKKHGVKLADKVHQRIGRAKQKYPSVSSWYKIETRAGKDGLLLAMTWEKQDEKKKSELGHYFLRTNLTMDNEANLWDIYNTIREI